MKSCLNHKNFFVVSLCAAVLGPLAGVAKCEKYGGGSGTADEPYLIYDANQMNYIGADPNDWDKNFKLMADVGLGVYTGKSFNIIGRMWLADAYNVALDVPGGKIYWADNGTDKIHRANLDGTEVKNLVTIGLDAPYGITLNLVGGKMYWTDYNINKIQRANLNGTEVEDLVTGLGSPHGIALDINADKMYWTDCDTTKIQRANLDGTGITDLVIPGLSCPFGITLDTTSGKIYWTDCGTDKIQRANLDGSGVEDLVTKGLRSPWGLALDVSGGKLYWTDHDAHKIQRANLDGTGVEDLITEGLSFPGGIDLDLTSGKMYWADGDKIKCANLDGTEVCNVLENKTFTGVFDGDGHTISNFTYDCNGPDCVGIFGYIKPGGEVKNLGLIDSNVRAGMVDRVGSLVGFLVRGTITNCYVEGGSVTGYYRVGGVVGNDYDGSISDCYSTGSVTGDRYVGGLVGLDAGNISNCYSEGSVTGDNEIGGLVGLGTGNISNCYSKGSVIGDTSVGGLVGTSFSRISRCYSESSVTGYYYVGGLVGKHAFGTIGYCYSTGSVAGSGVYTGGLVGRNQDGNIWDCYSKSPVAGYCVVGGLVGGILGSRIDRCYSAGTVTGTTDVGGLVGNSSSSYYRACFWDRDVNPDVSGIGNGSNPNVRGLPTVEMQKERTYTNAGWNFTTPIWTIREGVDYPRLWWENTAPIACVVGGDRAVEVGSGCEARVTLDGSCSSDADSTPGTNDDIAYFDWYEQIDPCDPNSDIFLGSGEIIDCNLPLGEHDIILEVIDKADAFDTNEVIITVEDRTPPEFSLSVEPDVLWPANHKMVLITPTWEVSDNCDELPEVTLVSISSNEDDDSKGDGHTSDDIQVKPDGSIWLRAERSGTGSSRIYTITYQAADDSGNITVRSATVTVPHDKR